MKKVTFLVALVVCAVAAFWLASVSAAPLPDNCTKDKGTVTCTTTDSPGNNQGGVGSTTTTEGQGNATNTNPTPQDLQSGCTQNPPKSQGNFSC